MSARSFLVFALAAAALAAVTGLAFATGRYPVAFADLLRVLWAWLGGAPHGLDPAIDTVVLQIDRKSVV